MVKQFFKLTSAQSIISLYSPLKDVQKIRIYKVYYITQGPTERWLKINIEGFKQNIQIVDGVVSKYTQILLLPNASNVPVLYESYLGEHAYDQIGGLTDINQLEINCFINDVLSTQITSLNPLYLELEFL